MIKKIKNYLLEIFNITCTGFTGYMIILIVSMLIDGNEIIYTNNIACSLLITFIASNLYYLVWYTNIFRKFKYIVKNVIFYVIVFIIILLFNNPSEMTLKHFIYLFIYYNIIYAVLWVIYVVQNKKEIEDLNRVINRIKNNDKESENDK